MFTEISRSAGMNRWTGCAGLSWKPLISLMDNRMYSEDTYQSDPVEDEPSTDITLDKIGLYKGQKFSLHYDFGDDWMFTITVSKISEAGERFEPRIVKSKGYIQQYPDLDEEVWDYE